MSRRAHSIALGLTLCSSIAAVILGMTAPARAVDGATEINQVRALAGGVPAGDAPGFPVSINASGSYVLTSNLTTAGTTNALTTTAIRVAVDAVTIDMNGFSILGPTVCDCGEMQANPECAPSGSGGGIEVTSPSVSRLAVFNGQFSGLPGNGVEGGQNSRISDLTTVGNGGNGASAGADSMVERIGSACNGGHGVVLTGSGTIRAVAARDNKLSGIRAETTRVLVLGSSARGNGQDGIALAGWSQVHGSTALQNWAAGISAGADTLVKGSVSAGNGGAGFSASQETLMTENVSVDNGTHGYLLGSGTGYQGVIANGNPNGTITGGVPVALNVCNRLPCP